ncbi:UNVERIFIED_CONTAM: hypothetical protein Sradi_6977000 [Sesamum radiatum]|uniref:Uncharacterized protein n=1 Tax=Sesamum radiatum TaxID=300843 RepID=A0AAW2JDG5_SESRA
MKTRGKVLGAPVVHSASLDKESRSRKWNCLSKFFDCECGCGPGNKDDFSIQQKERKKKKLSHVVRQILYSRARVWAKVLPSKDSRARLSIKFRSNAGTKWLSEKKGRYAEMVSCAYAFITYFFQS